MVPQQKHPGDAPLTSIAPAEVLAAQDLPTPQETISGDEGMVTVSGDSVLGSVTEVQVSHPLPSVRPRRPQTWSKAWFMMCPA